MMLKRGVIGLFLVGIGLGCGSPGGQQPALQPGAPKTGAAQNRPPVINGDINVSPKYLSPAGEATARVSANDPDPTDKLTYSWSVKGGEIIEGDGTPVLRFKIGEKSESVTIQVTVKDNNKAYAEKEKTLKTATQFLLLQAMAGKELKKGQVFPVRLQLQGVENLYGLAFTLEYNPAKFEFRGIQPQGLLGGEEVPFIAVDSPKPGSLKIALVKITGDPMKGDGLIATLSWKALEDFADPTQALFTAPASDDFPVMRAKDAKDLPIGLKVKNLLGGTPAEVVVPPTVSQPPPPAPDGSPPSPPPPPSNPPKEGEKPSR